MGSINEKNRGKKSRDTAPLSSQRNTYAYTFLTMWMSWPYIFSHKS